MRDTLEDVKQWRAKEIMKLYLLKSSFQLSFEERNQVPFDLIVSIVEEPEISFGVIILLLPPSEKELEKHINTYVDSSLEYYEIPVLLLLIDEAQESGKLDFVVAPDDQQLTFSGNFHFQTLNAKNLDSYLEKILTWGKRKGRKIA